MKDLEIIKMGEYINFKFKDSEIILKGSYLITIEKDNDLTIIHVESKQ